MIYLYYFKNYLRLVVTTSLLFVSLGKHGAVSCLFRNLWLEHAVLGLVQKSVVISRMAKH